MFGRPEEAFAFADAVIGSSAEVFHQMDYGELSLLVGQVIKDIHAAFGILHFLTGAIMGTCTLQFSLVFGADDYPVLHAVRQFLLYQLPQAGRCFGTLTVEA